MTINAAEIEKLPEIFGSVQEFAEEFTQHINSFESDCSSIITNFCDILRKSVEQQMSDIDMRINIAKETAIDFTHKKENYERVCFIFK